MKVSSIGLVRTLSAVSAFSLVMCVGCSGEDGGSESTSNPIDSGTETTTPGSDAGSPEDAEVPSDGPIPQDASPPDAPVEDGGPDQDGYVPYEPPCGNTNPTKAIGNWDVVPGQSFDGAFEVGVVAFHEYGVDVTFSVNGNVLATVKNPWLNPRTGAFEYFVTLKASDYPDGPITLNATITPDCSGHQARELQELVLYANAGGTQTNSTVKWVDCATGSDSSGNGTQGSPYETIEKAIVEVGAGGTVYLAAGTCYTLTKLYPSANYDRWTTVQPAPGVSRDQVVIMAEGPGSTGRFAEDMIRWKDVQIFKDASPGWSTLFYLESDHSVWFDGAELFDKNGQFNGGDVVGGNKPNFVYATDAIIRDVQNMTSICGFCRNVLAKNIGSDVFRARSNIMSIGMIVDTINKGSTDAHPDFFQFHAPNATIENIVIYNTKVINMGAQGIFGGGGGGVLRDVAFVNLVMQRTSSVGYLSQLSGSWEHVLFWNFTVSEGPFFLRETAGLKDFFIQNSIWHMLHAGSATSLPDFVIDTNLTRTLNWNQPEPMGTHTLEGDPLFVDEENRDFRLSANSPAREAGIPLPGVPADIDNKLYDISKPNLGAYAE